MILKPADLWKAWNAKKWETIYVFAGEEDYLIQEAVSHFKSHWLGPQHDPLQYEQYDGNTSSMDEILQSTQSLSLFSTKRLVCIRNAQEMDAATQKALAASLTSQEGDDAAFLIIWEKPWKKEDAEKAFMKTLSEVASVVVFWPLFEDQAARWAISHAQKLGYTLESEAAQYLIHELGSSLRLLSQEISKLTLFVHPEKTIRLTHVQQALGFSQDVSVFTWIDALLMKDKKQSHVLLEKLLAAGEEPIMLLNLLQRQMVQWIEFKQLGRARGYTPQKQLDRYQTYLPKWDIHELQKRLHQSINEESLIKSGKEQGRLSVSKVCLSFC